VSESRQGSNYGGIVFITREPEFDLAPYFHDQEDIRGTFIGHRESENGHFLEASPVESWADVQEAIAWGRSRAPLVVVRLGNTADTLYSAGAVQATDNDGPLPRWPSSPHSGGL
jgi:hypothetical protein